MFWLSSLPLQINTSKEGEEWILIGSYYLWHSLFLIDKNSQGSTTLLLDKILEIFLCGNDLSYYKGTPGREI